MPLLALFSSPISLIGSLLLGFAAISWLTPYALYIALAAAGYVAFRVWKCMKAAPPAAQNYSASTANRPARDDVKQIAAKAQATASQARESVSAILAQMESQVAAEKPVARGLEDALAELNELIGLEGVKNQVASFVRQAQAEQARRRKGLPTPDSMYHSAFMGPPGTGKTEVARLFGEIVSHLGIIRSTDGGKLKFRELTRADLVGQYQGQTSAKCKAIFEEEGVNVAFIDEAYALVQSAQDSFGKEAMDYILRVMTARKDSLIVVFAGYEREIEQLLETNPGLQSRVPFKLTFDPYNADALMKILRLRIRKAGNRFADEGAEAAAQRIVEEMCRGGMTAKANARSIETFEAKIRLSMSTRLAREGLLDDDDALTTITVADVNEAAAAAGVRV